MATYADVFRICIVRLLEIPMPNCNFYATTDDHTVLLTWLFNEGTCEIYELSSALEQPLRRFSSPKEVLTLFDERYPTGNKVRSIHLQLYVLGAGPQFVPRRVSLDPKACGGATFRYAAEGWGLVQLYLGTVWQGELQISRTNHNSQKRAEAWALVNEQESGVSEWDFKRITSFSSRLNRQIRKMSSGKISSCPVLPGALTLWESGMNFPPFHNGSVLFQRKES